MQKASYPERSCRQPVSGNYAEYICEVREHHAGPCASLSVPESVINREQWEAANPGHEKLTAFDDPFASVEEIQP